MFLKEQCLANGTSPMFLKEHQDFDVAFGLSVARDRIEVNECSCRNIVEIKDAVVGDQFRLDI